jgi:hypothetical protein
MSLSNIKKYFTPNSILDIGANMGQFYNEAKNLFPNSLFYLIEGNPDCEPQLKTLNIEYKIALLSDKVKTVDFYIREQESRCTGFRIRYYKRWVEFNKKIQRSVIRGIFN